MEDKELQERLIAFLKEDDSSEKKESKDRVCSDKEFQAVLHQLDMLSQQSCQPDKKRMWIRICRHVAISRRKRLLRRLGAVAAVLLPVLMGTILFLYFETSQPVQRAMPVVISRNQVQLFLNDGRVVHVQQLEKDSILEEKGGRIRIDTSHSVSYQPRNMQANELVYNTLYVPRCCEYYMELADGTQVWLNSDSELRFPVNFIGNERRVFLKGEGYFKVAEDAGKPFRVEAGMLEIEALGTEFDVNVYQDGGKSMTTLVEGKVKVADSGSTQTCVLEPGTQALLHNHVLTTAVVNVRDLIGWKEGRFVFSDMSMQDIACQLERWYDVKIDFEDVMVRYYRFTGVMKRYNQLNQLIEMIEETTDVKFKVYGREVKICRR